MADIADKRVTELWRAAADALDPTEDEYYAMGLRAERAEAECGRLREQLAAAEGMMRSDEAAAWLEESEARVSALSGALEALLAFVYALGFTDATKCVAAARAALGVVGEQEPDDDNLPSMLP